MKGLLFITCLLTVLVVTLTGCNSKGEIKGEVFVVTGDSRNIKLGDVEIVAIPESEIQTFLTSKKAEVQALNANLQQEYTQAKSAYVSSLSALNSSIQQAEQAAADVNRVRSEMNSASVEQLFSNRDSYLSTAGSSDRARQDAKEKYSSSSATYLKLQEIEQRLSANPIAKLYFDGMPRGIATTRTDAEGKFSISLPSKGRFALAAKADRQLSNKVENYYWLVWVSLDGGDKKNITLTNRNMIDTTSSDSVVSAPVLTTH